MGTLFGEKLRQKCISGGLLNLSKTVENSSWPTHWMKEIEDINEFDPWSTKVALCWGGVGWGSDPWDKTSFHAYAKGGNSWAESQASRAFVCLMSAWSEKTPDALSENCITCFWTSCYIHRQTVVSNTVWDSLLVLRFHMMRSWYELLVFEFYCEFRSMASAVCVSSWSPTSSSTEPRSHAGLRDRLHTAVHRLKK